MVNGASETVANELAAAAYELAKEASKMSYTAQALQAVTHATVSTGIQSVVYGYNSDEFSDLFIAALAKNTINVIGRNLSTKIGEAAKADPPDLTAAGQYIAHAAVGCFTGELTASLTEVDENNACVSGAGGAVIGEFIGQAHREELEKDISAWAEKTLGSYETYTFKEFDVAVRDFLQRGVDVGRLAAAFSAFAVGGDVDIAASTAETAAKYNATEGLNPYGTYNTVRRIHAINANRGLLLFDDILGSSMNKISRIGNGETLDISSETFFRDEALKYGSLYNILTAATEQAVMDTEFNVELYLAILLISIPVRYAKWTAGSDQGAEQPQLPELSEVERKYLEGSAEYQIKNAIRELTRNEELRREQISEFGSQGIIELYEDRIRNNIKVIQEGILSHPSLRVIAEQAKLTPGGIPIVENLATILAHPVPDMDQVITLIREILDEDINSGTLDNPAYDTQLPSRTETLIPGQNPLDTVMYSTSEEVAGISIDHEVPSQGGSGGRRNALNTPSPSEGYLVDGRYAYYVDSLGRTTIVAAEDLAYSKGISGGRSEYQQKLARQRGMPGVDVGGT